MLRKFRKSKVMKNIILWAVIGVFILFVFVAWGSGRISGGGPNVIAQVAGEKIDRDTFRQEFYAQIESLRDRLGDRPITKGLIERMGLAERVLQTLEYRIILKKIASKFHITVGDKELAQFIESMPAFQVNGVFVGPQEYKRRVMTLYRMSVPRFEQQMRLYLLERKLREVITAGVRLNPAELERAYRFNNEKFVAEILYYPYADVEVEKPTEEERKAYFQKHRDKFMVPERRKGEFVFISAIKMKEKVSILPRELKEYYDENKDMFAKPDLYDFIRVKVKTEKDLNALVAQLKKGTALEVAGKKFGKVEKVERLPVNAISPAERTWLSQARIDEISPPLKVKDGFEVVKLVRKIPGGFKKLSEVRPQVEEALKLKKAWELAADLAKKVYRDAKKKGLAQAAKKYGLKLYKTDFLRLGEPTEGDPTATVSAVLFQLKEGKISQPIRGYTGFFVVRLDKIQPSRPGKYEEFVERITEELLMEKKKERARKVLEEAVKGGKLPPAVLHKEVTTDYSRAFRDDNIELNPGAVEALLDAPLNKWSRVILLPRGALVFRIKERILDREKLKKELPKFAQQMLQREKDNFYRAFLQRQTESMKVKFNGSAFEKIKKELLGGY